MIMDGIDPMSAAAIAEHSAMSFSLVSFDTFDKGADCLQSASVFDRPVEDLNTPVTTSEMPTFFHTVDPLEEPEPPPITGKMLPCPPRPPRPLSPCCCGALRAPSQCLVPAAPVPRTHVPLPLP